MNGRRDHIVAGLPAIHVIVGMRFRQMPDHLVGVHVGGRAAAGLKNIDYELIVVPARRHLFGCFFDRRGQLRRQLPDASIHACRRALDQSQRTNERARKAQSG